MHSYVHAYVCVHREEEGRFAPALGSIAPENRANRRISDERESERSTEDKPMLKRFIGMELDY